MGWARLATLMGVMLIATPIMAVGQGVPLPQPAPKALRGHVVALAGELGEHLEPLPRGPDAFSGEQTGQIGAVRLQGHGHCA